MLQCDHTEREEDMGRQVKRRTLAYKQEKASKRDPEEVRRKREENRKRFYEVNASLVDDTRAQREAKEIGLRDGTWYK